MQRKDPPQQKPLTDCVDSKRTRDLFRDVTVSRVFGALFNEMFSISIMRPETQVLSEEDLRQLPRRSNNK